LKNKWKIAKHSNHQQNIITKCQRKQANNTTEEKETEEVKPTTTNFTYFANPLRTATKMLRNSKMKPLT
jgi:hypothetical protein